MNKHVASAYATMVLIWSTTPLAIQWSAHDHGVAFALGSRMILTAIIAGLLLAALRAPFAIDARTRTAYVVNGISTFCGLTCVYWAAQFVSSGVIATVLGLSPLLTQFAESLFDQQRPMTRGKVLALILGIVGLGIVFLDTQALGHEAWKGILATVLSCIIFTAGGVAVKYLGNKAHPVAMTFGSTCCAVPCYILLWYISDGYLPSSLSHRELGAILYLAIFGLAGLTCCYYVMKRVSYTQVALANLVTPVFSLVLATELNGDVLARQTLLGALLIMLGLALYQIAERRSRVVLPTS